MGAITLFFLVYLLLIVLSVLLSVACVMLGIGIISMLTNFLGLAAGLGVVSIGVLVFVFLVKFIFSVKKFDTAGNISISEAEQPELFGFIRQLTKDTQTQFPRKIVLSPEVNACVFYNDSFWSMIFPVKKNLQIGLGLVNTLTVSEFKAVMAHEFGHFSQRSMKLGSFVYNVNKVIYNMLYENKNYAAFIQGWGNLHWAIYIFVSVTVELVKGIQYILQKMYGFINKSYMSLSREMEFHADAVAASVSGGNHLVAALQKLEVSDTCYNTVIEKANDFLKDKKVFENVYAKHQVVMAQYAREYNLPLLNNVPQLTPDFYKNFQQSRINIKNQWASHPTREDREKHLLQLHIDAVADNRPAWILFSDPASLQKKVTDSLYRTVPDHLKEQSITDEVFKERYLTDIDVYNLPAAYNGYFDNHQLNEMDFQQCFSDLPDAAINTASFSDLFSAEKTGFLQSLRMNEADAQLLEAIANKQADIKTFDYNGEKYKVGAAATVLEKLRKEIEAQKIQVQQNEEKIVRFFYAAAKLKSDEAAQGLKTRYLLYDQHKKKLEEYTAICHRVVALLSPLRAGQQVSIQAAADMASGLRKESNSMKPLLAGWIEQKAFDKNASLNTRVQQFCGVNYHYFSGDSFFDNELKHLHELVNETMLELIPHQFKEFKTLLEYQLEVYR